MSAAGIVSSDHEACKVITDLDGQHVELAEAIGDGQPTRGSRLPRHSLRENRLTTGDS